MKNLIRLVKMVLGVSFTLGGLLVGVLTVEKTLAQQPNEWSAPAGARELSTRKGSSASFDDRLPPVLPGEVIGQPGNEMKVWSSAGPLQVDPDVEIDGHNDSGPVGVIVDQRHSRPSNEPIKRSGEK